MWPDVYILVLLASCHPIPTTSGNSFEADAGVTFGRAADVVVEGNHFADVQVAICLSNRTGRLSLARQGLLVRNNDFHSSSASSSASGAVDHPLMVCENCEQGPPNGKCREEQERQ